MRHARLMENGKLKEVILILDPKEFQRLDKALTEANDSVPRMSAIGRSGGRYKALVKAFADVEAW